MIAHKFAQKLVFITVAICLAGCAAFQPAPRATPTLPPLPTLTATPQFPLPEGAIIFEIDPTRKFAGHIYGQGETAIILANMTQGGETQWDPLVAAIDHQKFTLVTFNYLQADAPGAVQGVLTVLARLRDVGYTHLVCIGASLGVSACGSIASAPEMVGLVMIAGQNTAAPVNGSYPKLFIAGADDPWSKATQTAYTVSAEPKQILIFTGLSNHGTDLFYSDKRAQFLQALLDFVNNL